MTDTTRDKIAATVHSLEERTMNTADMIASTLRTFPDLSKFSHVEVNPVTLWKEDGKEYAEALPPDTPENHPDVHLWSVYLRYWPTGENKQFGGVDWVIDYITKGAAMHFAEELRKLLPNPAPVPFSVSNGRDSL